MSTGAHLLVGLQRLQNAQNHPENYLGETGCARLYTKPKIIL